MNQFRLVSVSFSLLIAIFVSCSAGTQKSGETDGKRIEWTRLGSGGGGAQYLPTISPHDENMVFITCDMGGSYVTCDGGESWRMFNLDGKARFFVFDPVDPNVVYAQSSGLFKSEDKGRTWTLFYPKPSDVLCMISKGDNGSVTILTKDSLPRSVQALAIDPVQSKHLYAVISMDRSIALYTSVDGGQEWKKEKDFKHSIMDIFIDPSSPADQRTLYLTWNKGVEQRVNGKWQSYGTPGKDVIFNIFSGGYDAVTKKFIIYSMSGKGSVKAHLDTIDDSVESGIFISRDGGKTWENRQNYLLKHSIPGSKAPEYAAIATSAFNPATVYVMYKRMTIHADTTSTGIAKSEDFGKTWTLTRNDKSFKWGFITSPNLTNNWIADWGWGGNLFNFGVAPANANVAYGTDPGRTFKTVNGGRTYEVVNSNQLPDGSWTSRGTDVVTCYDIVFDPFDENHIFLSLTDIGLNQSKNGGKGWNPISLESRGVPKAWRNTTYWTVFDPEVKGRAWAAMAGTHDLPRPKMFDKSSSHVKMGGGVDNYLKNYKGGVALTNDGGESWKPVSESIGEAAMTHILLDPTSGKNARTLYACAFGKGVYKSTDGGLSWVQKNNGITGSQPFAFRISRRESDGTLFLIVSRRSVDDSLGTDWDGALYKSTDGAETWVKMTLPEGCNGPTDIITAKKYPKRLVLSAWGRVTGGRFSPNIGGGIFISDDEGKSWTQVMENDQHVYSVSFDPRNGRYYACGFKASAYYSDDGAKTWTRIKGYNFRMGHRVVPDPRDPEKIFVLTFGGGVWYGPATGDPDAIEDVVTQFDRR